MRSARLGRCGGSPGEQPGCRQRDRIWIGSGYRCHRGTPDQGFLVPQGPPTKFKAAVKLGVSDHTFALHSQQSDLLSLSCSQNVCNPVWDVIVAFQKLSGTL